MMKKMIQYYDKEKREVLGTFGREFVDSRKSNYRIIDETKTKQLKQLRAWKSDDKKYCQPYYFFQLVHFSLRNYNIAITPIIPCFVFDESDGVPNWAIENDSNFEKLIMQ